MNFFEKYHELFFVIITAAILFAILWNDVHLFAVGL